MELEDKAKVVASDWGAKFIKFLAALAVFLGLFERKGQIHSIFPNRQGIGQILPPQSDDLYLVF